MKKYIQLYPRHDHIDGDIYVVNNEIDAIASVLKNSSLDCHRIDGFNINHVMDNCMALFQKINSLDKDLYTDEIESLQEQIDDIRDAFIYNSDGVVVRPCLLENCLNGDYEYDYIDSIDEIDNKNKRKIIDLIS